MGDRAVVTVIDGGNPPLYLYTHWGGSALPDDLMVGLQRGKSRWHDPSYLARIIFDSMTEDATSNEIGFGIGTSEFDTNYPQIVLFGIYIYLIPYGTIFDKSELGKYDCISFEDFIQGYGRDWDNFTDKPGG